VFVPKFRGNEWVSPSRDFEYLSSEDGNHMSSRNVGSNILVNFTQHSRTTKTSFLGHKCGADADSRSGHLAGTSLETSCLSQQVKMLYALVIARFHYLQIQAYIKVYEIKNIV
jgi:hypothetical protein